MTIEEKQQEIIEEFKYFSDWQEKYNYIIDLGKDLSLIKNDQKIDDNLIDGCQAKVWLHSEYKDNVMKYYADSDGIIVKGIISLLISVLNNETPETIIKCDLNFIKEINLQEHLTYNRGNGLVAMVKKMKTEALKYLNN